ncbi:MULTISPECIES: glycosyl transferase [unclassified Microbacterium]|uniref:glycosyl transferase n=1 Tax=unclassified Microbacterium TaxID=2609290 RepID=UPI0012FB66AE|nr:glycosyl transferase [Microbacterium sp. MAH-37]MVQ42371.1 glycosyl transferase [Microbacterium sp. MAH-37]
MRFVWAVVAFILAAVLIGAGVAQRTVFMGPSEVQMELPAGESEPYVLISGDVLRAHPGQQTLLVRGEGDLFVAYGRTADMKAWLSDAEYDSVTLDKKGEPRTKVVKAEVESTSETGRNPAGSDLWLDSFTDKDSLIANLQLPEGMSVLVARDGVEDAPSDILLTWPLKTTTPWVGPLFVLGGLALLVGLVLYILGIRHQRRGKGPRRKGPGPLPPTQPIDLAVDPLPEREPISTGSVPTGEGADEPADKPADEGRSPRTAHRMRRRLAVAIPAIGLTAVLATGCSADSWPQFDAQTSPTPTPTVVAPDNQKPPAVTEAQAARILKDISKTVTAADEARDVEQAKTRLDGAVLEARTTDYALGAKNPNLGIPAPLPADKVEVVLPQSTDAWPRTVLMLTKASDEKVPPVIFTMTQADPWSNYRIGTMSDMQASAKLPKLAPAWLGTTLVPPDSTFLMTPPDEVAEAFSSLVDEGEKSPYLGEFDDASKKQAEAITASRAALVKAVADKGAAKTTKIDFDMTPSDFEPVSLATLDSGAIVSVSVVDTQTIAPTTPDAVIKFDGNPEAEALTGAKESKNGVRTTYGMQLFFAVPAQGASAQIQLLAFHQNILKVEIIP